MVTWWGYERAIKEKEIANEASYATDSVNMFDPGLGYEHAALGSQLSETAWIEKWRWSDR